MQEGGDNDLRTSYVWQHVESDEEEYTSKQPKEGSIAVA